MTYGKIMSGTEQRPEPKEFEEVAHSGGRVSFLIVTQNGRRTYQIGWQNSRPVASGLKAVHALPPGVPVAPMSLGGSGSPPDAPPMTGCFPVFIASDSEGKFGQECPACGGYWRSGAWANICPYCGTFGQPHYFLTSAQRRYIQQYFCRLAEALNSEPDGEHVIDMDAVAEAAGKDAPKPPFYYAEVRQQNKFTCAACGAFNDILGTFGYCSGCGTRNNLQELENKTIPQIRDRINAGGQYEACVKDGVAAFDCFAGDYVSQLLRLVPVTAARKARLEQMRFHNLANVANELKTIFDIDLLEGLRPDDVAFAGRMFHRRHVYEHRGGEADEKYISDSGDRSVRIKQALRETQETAHRLVGIVVRMARNIHRGFHEFFPPIEARIESYRKWHRPTNT